MTMSEWVELLNGFLELANYPILIDKGKISQHTAKLKALSEFDKFRVQQDFVFESDFDIFSKKMLKRGQRS